MNIRFLKNQMVVIMALLLMTFTTNCGDSDDPQLSSTYSGTGSFNFTGDTTFTFQGSVSNSGTVPINDYQFLPVNVKNGDLTLLIGVNGRPSVVVGSYEVGEMPVQAYTTITLLDELYDAKSGTVTISTYNQNEIKGSIDVALRALFSFSDDLFIQGTFELTAE